MKIEKPVIIYVVEIARRYADGQCVCSEFNYQTWEELEADFARHCHHPWETLRITAQARATWVVGTTSWTPPEPA